MADPQQGAEHQPRVARPIGTYDRPNIHGYRLGIQAPAVAANNFEVKSGLLNMIENNKYHGLALEDPFDHLDRFDSYCGLSKTNGVSEDALKLKLFPFSLGDKARQWEKSLPSDSITTWDECKRAFLEKFFSSSRTAKLRNEISSFQQKGLEGFSEAWERFKGYQAQCPHHDFSKESLLSTFYRGALPKHRARLDTASNGFFLGRTEDDAEELVDNMVKSDAVYSGDHDRGSRGADKQTRKEIKALQDKIDILLADKATQEQLHFVGNPSQETPPVVHEVEGLEGQEELCFINNNGSWYKKEPNFQYNNYQQKSYPNNQHSGHPPRNNQQGNYQPQQNPPPGFSNKGNQSSQQQANPSTSTSQESSTDVLLKQILESQTRSEKQVGYELKNLHSKIDVSYNELNNKFRALENQFASMTTHQNRQQGSLPGKSEQKPKEYCNVVLSTSSSGIELSNHKKEVDEIEGLVFGTEIEQVEHLIVATAEAKIVEEADKMVEAKILKGDEPMAEKPVEKRANQKLKEIKLEDTTEVEQSPYDKLPFPQRVLTKAQKKVISKFRKDLSDIGVKLPEISGMREAHVQMMIIKDIVNHQAEVAELLNISTLKLDPAITPKSLPKLESQGKFTLSCFLGKLTFDDALVDSGASVNVISMEMVKSLEIEHMESDTSSLTFGDSSSTTPIGLIKDFPLKIGSCTIPIDLTVLKMATEKRVPLILGTPFLTTVGACIDFANKKVTLLNVNKAVSYPIQFPLDVEYYGTITCGDPYIEKDPPSQLST
ncbi:hypothetical protein YC2023_018556 [Brassica napus]